MLQDNIKQNLWHTTDKQSDCIYICKHMYGMQTLYEEGY